MLRILLVAVVVVAAGAGTAGGGSEARLRPQAQVAGARPRLPSGAQRIPLVRQQTDYSCGPAVLASILTYFGAFSGDEVALYGLLGTDPEFGTAPEDLLRGARHFGLQAELEQGMTLVRLRALVEQRKLVILDVQAWPDDGRKQAWSERWDDGHYVVLIGLDDRFAYLMDPSVEGSYAYVPLRELVERWHDFEPRPVANQGERFLQLGVVIWRDASPSARAARARRPPHSVGQAPGPLVRME